MPGEKKENKVKRWKKIRINVKRVKPSTSTPGIDALIEDDERMGKKKREHRKEQGVDLQPSYCQSDDVIYFFKIKNNSHLN